MNVDARIAGCNSGRTQPGQLCCGKQPVQALTGRLPLVLKTLLDQTAPAATGKQIAV
jgi:hypothetical protein